MNLELVRPAEQYREQLTEMLTEWREDILTHDTDRSPWRLWAHDFRDFDGYLSSLEAAEKGWVPDTTLFCLDRDRGIFVGAVNLRPRLNEELLRTGGHIGDGIRPSQRRRGYATAMIALALEECRRLGLDRVLMCCSRDNIGSVRSILRNGGVLENEVEEGGRVTQRYWIELPREDPAPGAPVK